MDYVKLDYLYAQVALGNIKELHTHEYMEQPPAGFNSVKGLGRQFPDFAESIVLPSGT